MGLIFNYKKIFLGAKFRSLFRREKNNEKINFRSFYGVNSFGYGNLVQQKLIRLILTRKMKL